MRLPLAYGGIDYLDRTHALATGEVSPLGVELNFQSMAISELFRRMCRHAEFEAAELSLSTTIVMHSQGDDRFVAIPVFPARAFRQRQLYVRADSELEKPEDLAGKRVGLREYTRIIAAALWIRAFLQHDYGVAPESIDWFYGGVETPYWAERLEHPAPPGVRLERIPADRSLSDLIVAGELDAPRRHPERRGSFGRRITSPPLPRLPAGRGGLPPPDRLLPDHAHRGHPP